MTTTEIPQNPAASRAVVSSAATEWDEPLNDWSRCYGDTGTAKTITMTMSHDSGGQIWIEIQVGSENVYLRPENVQDFAHGLWARSLDWANCHWDVTLNLCISKSCMFKQGKSHVGRLLPWQQMRARHVIGDERDPEILRLWGYGLTRHQIAIRVGWSISTVSKVIREAS